MKPIIDVNEANFAGEVLDSTRPVIVDFWAEWCGPCKMIAPVLEEITAEYPGRYKIARVNVDENRTLARNYHVWSIPTLLYFANGLVHAQLVGIAGKMAILSKLEELNAQWAVTCAESAGGKPVEWLPQRQSIRISGC